MGLNLMIPQELYLWAVCEVNCGPFARDTERLCKIETDIPKLSGYPARSYWSDVGAKSSPTLVQKTLYHPSSPRPFSISLPTFPQATPSRPCFSNPQKLTPQNRTFGGHENVIDKKALPLTVRHVVRCIDCISQGLQHRPKCLLSISTPRGECQWLRRDK